MYGKIFDSMYDGTLRGHWQAIVTLQQLIVLATPDGIVDMTPESIAARTSIPLKIIKAGLAHLEKADPGSRTPGEEGRRISLIDEHRPWGWVIVNHEKYKNMRDADTVRAQTRERVRKFREKRAVTLGNALQRHSYSDSDSDSKEEKSTTTASDATRPTPKVNGRRISFDPSKGAFQGITDEDELRWQEAYPAVIVPQEIKAAAAWLAANPANRKSNNERYIVNWLKRSQDKAGRVRR